VRLEWIEEGLYAIFFEGTQTLNAFDIKNLPEPPNTLVDSECLSIEPQIEPVHLYPYLKVFGAIAIEKTYLRQLWIPK
jgi:hypothetical protein